MNPSETKPAPFDGIEPTSSELALAQQRKARTAAAEEGGRAIGRALECMDRVRQIEVDAINLLREAGRHFIVASGRQMLLFNEAGTEFCRKEVIPHLPAGCGLRHVKLAVHLANTLVEPIRTVEELRAVKREVQEVMDLFGLADRPHRKELQQSHPRNFYVDYVDRVRTLDVLFRKMEEERPMEDWPPEQLDEFLEDSAPARAQITRAERLRLGLPSAGETSTSPKP